jgi:16S rRNA (uracil1498-N3)-methyltransferase
MITIFALAPLELGDITLDESAAHHAKVRRLGVGDPVAVTEGTGFRRIGRIAALSKHALVVTVERLEKVPQPPPLHLFVPVADRDRMLWLAEKATELQVTTWSPVMYQRSKSVAPRGDGEAFDRKLQARMASALEQSGGTWLPTILPANDPAHLVVVDGSPRLVLERGGARFGAQPGVKIGMSIAVGPEGGFEPDELTTLRDAGWITASLGDVTLRFETAAVAAIAIARDAMEREQGR